MKVLMWAMAAARSIVVAGGARPAVGDVVVDGVVEQHGILRHDADRFAQAVLGHVAHVLAVDRDPPGVHVVEAVDQARQRRLAGAAVTDHGDLLPRRHLEIERVQDRALRLVAEIHGLETNPATRDLQRRRAGTVGDLGLAFEQFEDQVHIGQRILDLAIHDAEKAQRDEQLQQKGIEQHQVADADVARLPRRASRGTSPR